MEKKEDRGSLPCPIFFRTHCPDIKKGCKYHHNTQMCSQGGACIIKTCLLRHPPNCQLFLQGWCGFITKQGIPKRYRHCSYFHPPNVTQIAPSPPQNSVKLITASNPLTTTPPVTGKNTSPENNQNIPQIPPASALSLILCVWQPDLFQVSGHCTLGCLALCCWWWEVEEGGYLVG